MNYDVTKMADHIRAEAEKSKVSEFKKTLESLQSSKQKIDQRNRKFQALVREQLESLAEDGHTTAKISGVLHGHMLTLPDDIEDYIALEVHAQHDHIYPITINVGEFTSDNPNVKVILTIGFDDSDEEAE